VSVRRVAGNVWPSRRERLLLLTALAEPDQALTAWLELRPELDLQTTEDSMFAALPLVFRRLEAAGIDDRDLPRLKGIYRNTWVRNTLLVERLQQTVEAFRAADVHMLLVGSIGTALRYYDTIGLRPTGHLELLVQERELTRAVRALGDAGWSTRGRRRSGPAEPLALFDGRGSVCLVRTTLAADFVGEKQEPPEASLWAAAIDLDIGGALAPALCPTDDLLAAIVTGARAKSPPSVQWIVDAAMILRKPQDVDRERLWRTAVERRQGVRLGDALTYLRDLLGSSLTLDLEPRLERGKASTRERLTYACASWTIFGLGSLSQALGEHLAATTGQSAWATATAVPRFLRDRWELQHTWQLPAEGGRRALRNLARGRFDENGPAG
jgi:hypothetical protein